jgi:hypothetical protein
MWEEQSSIASPSPSLSWSLLFLLSSPKGICCCTCFSGLSFLQGTCCCTCSAPQLTPGALISRRPLSGDKGGTNPEESLFWSRVPHIYRQLHRLEMWDKQMSKRRHPCTCLQVGQDFRPGTSKTKSRDRALEICDTEILARLNGESLACVLEEDLCRGGRFGIQRNSTFANGDSRVLRQSFAVDNHQLGSVIG